MQTEDEIWRSDRQPDCGASSLGGGADSSNRPWETDSLRTGAGDPPLTLGLLAICAAAVLSLADMALAYAPEGGYGFGLYQPFEALPQWRLMLGHCTGMLLLPAYIPGYWQVCRNLREAGAWLSRAVFVIGSLTAVIAATCHGGVALRALMVQTGFGGPASERVLGLARGISDPLSGWINIPFALASFGFTLAVLSGRTRFPRWLAYANPMVVGLVFVAPSLAAPTFLPALLAAPASFNLAHLVFFCLVTASLRQDRPD